MFLWEQGRPVCEVKEEEADDEKGQNASAGHDSFHLPSP